MSKRDRLIKALAEYLTSSVAKKSVMLQMGDADAIAWAKAYGATGCPGYSTAADCEQAIRETLGSEARS